MRPALVLAGIALLAVAVAPTASAHGPDMTWCYQIWNPPPPYWNQTCGDLEYVADHWTTEIAYHAALTTLDTADCLASKDPYNTPPSGYVGCVPPIVLSD